MICFTTYAQYPIQSHPQKIPSRPWSLFLVPQASMPVKTEVPSPGVRRPSVSCPAPIKFEFNGSIVFGYQFWTSNLHGNTYSLLRKPMVPELLHQHPLLQPTLECNNLHFDLDCWNAIWCIHFWYKYFRLNACNSWSTWDCERCFSLYLILGQSIPCSTTSIGATHDTAPATHSHSHTSQ